MPDMIDLQTVRDARTEARIRVCGKGNATEMLCPDGDGAYNALRQCIKDTLVLPHDQLEPIEIEAVDEARQPVFCLFHPDQVELVFKFHPGKIMRPIVTGQKS